MPVGRPISLTPNVATQNFTVTATADQTSFTVTGGYRLNELGVYRNGVRLIQGKDFTATDGSTVTLLSGAVVDDVIEFQIFDSFNIADAISSVGNQTIDGELTATKFIGDGGGLTGVGTDNINTNNIKVSGISTFGSGASTFPGAVSITDTTASTSTTTGALKVTGGVGIAGSLHVGENVSVGGTLTYEDVTNIDSVGVVTARLGVVVTAGRGVQITAGGLNVDAGIGTFDAGISLPDDKSITLGNDDDLEIHHAAGSNSYIKNNTLALDIRGDTTNINSKNNSVTFLKANASGFMATTGIGTVTTLKATTGTFSSDVDIADTIVHTGDTNTKIRFPAADTITAETSGSERLRIDSSGNVGINTTNPNHELTVFGDEPNFRLTHSGSTNKYNALYANVNGTGAEFNSYQDGTGTRRPFAFKQYTTEVLSIDASGNVGVGTAGPSAFVSLLQSGGNAKLQLQRSNAASNTDDYGSVLWRSMQGTAVGGINVARQTAEDDGYMFFQTASGGTLAERMRITKTGGLSLNNGELVERCYINSTAWSTNGDINLDNGMVQYNSANLAGTNNTLNITSSVGINTQMATGDIISVTCITAVNATSAYVNHITIDHTAVTENWVGGSAPTAGGGSGLDTYAFNIIKTGSAAYKVIANQVKTS